MALRILADRRLRVENDIVFCEMVQDLCFAVRQNDDAVFNAHAEFTAKVDTRLDGKAHARLEMTTVVLFDVWRFMAEIPDAVTQTCGEPGPLADF